IVFDRRLYRPGEEMFFKAALAVRQDGRLHTDGDFIGPVQAVIKDRRGNQMYSETLSPSAEGGVWGSMQLPEDAPTGHYSVQITWQKVADMDRDDMRDLRESYRYNAIQFNRHTLAGTFQVEEYRPVQFAVQVTGPDEMQAGQKANIELNGMHLFGAPMVGARAQYTVQHRRKEIHFNHLPAFRFGDGDYRAREYNWTFFARGDGNLGADGSFQFELPATGLETENKDIGLENVKLVAPLEFSIEGRVRDVDDKSVVNTKLIPVYPGTLLPGISVNRYYQSSDKPFQFQLIAVTPQGTPGGNMPAVAHIIRNEWKTIQSRGPGGTLQRTNTLVRTPIYEKAVTLSNAPQPFEYKVDKAGWYSLIVRGANGGAYSRVSFYAFGSGFYGWNFPDDDRVELLPDRQEYNVGDTARILIQSPFKSARAIVSVERENIYWQKTYDIEGNGEPIEVPILAEYAPTVYVSVMLVRGRVEADQVPNPDEEEEDLGRPQFKMGYAQLTVSPEQYRLPLTIQTNRPFYAPRDPVTLTIQTAPHAEVTLAVADRAVLDLINYHYGDPMEAFYKNWPHGLVAMENLESLIRQLTYTRKGQSPGGKALEEESRQAMDGGFDRDGEDGLRKNFKHTAEWSPALRADADGKVTLRFELPDNLTTFRVMALASRQGKFATTEHEFRVQQPLVVQPLVPRFIRPGDELQMGAVIVNQSGKDARIQVQMESPLLTFKGRNSTQGEITIPSGQSREIAFTGTLNTNEYTSIKNKIIDQLRNNADVYTEGIRATRVVGTINAQVLNTAAFNDAGIAPSG
ncbi:MAG: hypothetical protein KDK34_00005, partial [Leptospiraceae bacterium]|nr:hypothetical protein [Leptospiraceae bacterium]